MGTASAGGGTGQGSFRESGGARERFKEKGIHRIIGADTFPGTQKDDLLEVYSVAPIIASGPNSANPHATPTDRRLAKGDMLVIDWGANVGGYFSDLTRTFSIGGPEAEMAKIAQIVLEANESARMEAGPGVPAQDVDRAARRVIDQAGYGEYFTHRTGHGLGMEGHEEPYIREGIHAPLKPGMTFTIEPGIYLPGRGGVRIEDDVVITENGLHSFSDMPRALRVLGD